MDLSNFDISGVFDAIDYIESIWDNGHGKFSKEWKKGLSKPELHIELHTGGWSDNETIIGELLRNHLFVRMFHSKWIRGGHYYFDISPIAIGYYQIGDMCFMTGKSRQWIARSKDYESITYGKGGRNKLYRLKKL